MKILMKILEKLMGAIASLITRGITAEVLHDIRHVERNIKFAPTCCNNPMKFIGEHSGHFLKTQFYQCPECKRLELLHKHDWEK